MSYNKDPHLHDDDQNWSIEIWNDRFGYSPFARSFDKLDDYDQAVVDIALKKILQPRGINVVATEWGKNLGGGLYEFRIRRTLRTLINLNVPPEHRIGTKQWHDRRVLLRIFCTFHGDRVILLFQGYDKKRDPSAKRQQREIKKARKYLRQWKQRL